VSVCFGAGLGNDDGRPQPRVGVRVRCGDVTVRVMGEELPLTLSVERAARLVGIGRSSMYLAVKRGDFATIPVRSTGARRADAAAAAADGAGRAGRRAARPRTTLGISHGSERSGRESPPNRALTNSLAEAEGFEPSIGTDPKRD
jgi:hypothetical protein